MKYFHGNAELFFFTIAIAVASFGFLLYHYVSISAAVRKFLKTEFGRTRYVLFHRLTGCVIFGFLPLSIIIFSGTGNISDYGVAPANPESCLWIGILSVIIIPVNFFNSRTPGNLEMYPQIREKIWSVGILILSALSWIAYLLCYEFLFRGFLLFASIPLLGLWPSIVLNTSLYTLIHLPKGFKETIGAIPLGFLLCFLTVRTGSIWVAVFTHIIMALSNEWLSLYVHPHMVIKIRQS